MEVSHICRYINSLVDRTVKSDSKFFWLGDGSWRTFLAKEYFSSQDSRNDISFLKVCRRSCNVWPDSLVSHDIVSEGVTIRALSKPEGVKSRALSKPGACNREMRVENERRYWKEILALLKSCISSFGRKELNDHRRPRVKSAFVLPQCGSGHRRAVPR